MIELTTPEGHTVWVNPDHIVAVQPRSDGQGAIVLCRDNFHQVVANDVDNIIERIREVYL